MASLLVHVLLVLLLLLLLLLVLLLCPLRGGTAGYSLFVLLGRLRDGTAALHFVFVRSEVSQARVYNVSQRMY